jgi:hypothetical protein
MNCCLSSGITRRLRRRTSWSGRKRYSAASCLRIIATFSPVQRRESGRPALAFPGFRPWHPDRRPPYSRLPLGIAFLARGYARVLSETGIYPNPGRSASYHRCRRQRRAHWSAWARGKIDFWDHEREPDRWDGVVETAGNLSVVADSFLQFVSELRPWTNRMTNKVYAVRWNGTGVCAAAGAPT